MLALLLAVAAQAATPDVVVTARRLEEASAACQRKGACTPLEDARASIAWAEHQFRQGAYLKAKRTLSAALGRNRGFAKSDPRPVAALYEAYATVSLHDGDLREYRQGVGGQVRTLRDNLPPTDRAVAAAELALGDMWVKLNDVRSADAAYRAAERGARARGQSTFALVAGLRRVWLTAATGAMGRAETMLAAIAREGAGDRTIAAILPIVRLQLAARRADDGQVDAIVATLAQSTTARPTLVWAPEYAPGAARARDFDLVDSQAPRSSDSGDIQWADVGFWIRPDGRTEDVEVLRGTRARGWLGPILTQVAGRRYSATADEGGSPGNYRVERFTFRGTYQVPTGSMIRRRAGQKELEILDLTAPSQSANGR